jgi:hypothetical protein
MFLCFGDFFYEPLSTSTIEVKNRLCSALQRKFLLKLPL